MCTCGGQKKGIRFPGTRVTHSCKSPYGWETKQGPSIRVVYTVNHCAIFMHPTPYRILNTLFFRKEMKKKQNHFKQHNGKMLFPQNNLPYFSSFKSFLKPNEVIFWGSRNGKLSLNNELYIIIIYIYYMPYMYIYIYEHINIIWWVLSIHGLHPLNCWSKYLLKIINPTHLFWQCHYSMANTEKHAFE